MNRLDFFKKRRPIYREKPREFAREVCQLEPDTWQLEVLKDLASHSKVSVRSGQGVGKTGLEAVAILWFLTCFPFPKSSCHSSNDATII